MTEIEKGRSKSFIKNPFNSVNVQLAKMVRKSLMETTGFMK